MVSSFTAKLMSLEKVINHLSSANSQQEIPAEFWIPTMITYFKLSFELSWKVMKKHMQDRFIDSATTGSPRDIIKLAYKEHYIDNEQLWEVLKETDKLTLKMLVMRMQGFSGKEISCATGVPELAINNRIARLRKKIKKFF